MAKITKNRKKISSDYDPEKRYPVAQGVALVKKNAMERFDAGVDIAVRLEVNPQKPDQMVRGVVGLKHGIGKVPTVLALCASDKEAEAKAAGADFVGLEEYIDKITKGWTAVDAIVTTPSLMAKVGRLGRVLGPRGLMPNPKTGTVTDQIGKAIEAIKKGKISFKVDKFGIVHARIGATSFSAEALEENIRDFVATLVQLKPATAKGIYLKSITIASTMGPGVAIAL